MSELARKTYSKPNEITELSTSTRRSQRQYDLPLTSSTREGSKLKTDVSVSLEEVENTKTVRTISTSIRDTPRSRNRTTTIEEGSMGFHQMMALPKSFLLYSNYIKSTNPKEINENLLIPILCTKTEYKGDNLNEESSDSEDAEEIKEIKPSIIYDESKPEKYEGPLDNIVIDKKDKKKVDKTEILTSMILTIEEPKYVFKEESDSSKKKKKQVIVYPDTIDVTNNVLTFTILNNPRPGDESKTTDILAKEKSLLFSEKLQKQKIYDFGDLDLISGNETGPDPIDPLIADPQLNDTTTLLKSKLLRTTVARSPSIGTPGRNKAKDVINIKILKPKSEKLKSQIITLEQGVIFTEFEALELEPINELVDTEFFQDKVKEEFDIICPVIDSYDCEPENYYLTRFKPIQIPEIKLSIITIELLLNPEYRYSTYIEILDKKKYYRNINKNIDESVPVIDSLKVNIRRNAFTTYYDEFNHIRLNTHDCCIYYPINPNIKRVHIETMPFILRPIQRQKKYIEFFRDFEKTDDVIPINLSSLTESPMQRRDSFSSLGSSTISNTTTNTTTTTTTGGGVGTLKVSSIGTPTHLRKTVYSSTPTSTSTRKVTTTTSTTVNKTASTTPSSSTTKIIGSATQRYDSGSKRSTLNNTTRRN